MSNRRWQQIQDLFHQAEELDAPARSAFLDSACAEDPGLRNEVESLLAAVPGATGFFGAPAADTDDQDRSGERIGAYRLVHRLGAGGMGVVYLAERADGEFAQRVAIKLVKSPLLGPQVIERFRAEREILAQLEHPNIARLLDGGTTGLGQPYLVMEYVEGVPINEFCALRKLDTRARLKLFNEVCAAVAYAHSQLVVHRDIKPGNILVTDSGTPKLLDFGIARLLTEDTARSGTHHPALTPEYASPEQVRGEPVSAASDIYSLGILLYELLTGSGPYRFTETTPEEIVRVVCETPATLPSAAAFQRALSHPARLRRELAGDLDAIVLNALDKSPGNRYRSVERLSEDILRHMEYRPVSARSASKTYVTGRFLRRHRASVSTAAGALLAVLAGAMMAVWGMVQAQTERDRAQVEALRAEQTSGFVSNMLSAIDPDYAKGADTELLRRVLQDAAQRAPLELADQPDVHSEVQYVIGRAYHQLGEYDRALAHFEQAASLLEDQPLSSGHLRPLVARARLLNVRGEYAQAQLQIDPILEALSRQQPVDEPLWFSAQLAKVHALAEMREDRVAEEIVLELLGRVDEDQSTATHLGILQQLAKIHANLGREAESVAVFERIRERASAWNEPSAERYTINALDGQAVVYLRQKEYEQAEPLLHESVARREQRYGESHPGLVKSLNNQAIVLRHLDRVDEAILAYRRSLDIARESFGDTALPTLIAQSNFSNFLRASGTVHEALHLQRQVLAAMDASVPAGHPVRGHFYVVLGQAELAVGNNQAAIEALRQGIEHYLEHYPADHHLITEAREVLTRAEQARASAAG